MKKRRDKKKTKFKYIFLSLFTILTIIFTIFLKLINVLPKLYFLIILSIVLILYIINFILIKKKKKIGYIISTILIIIYAIVTYYLGITLNFFSAFSGIHYNEETYLVLVLKENNYKKIEDIENKNIGYINSELNNINKALKKLDKKVTINKEEYTEYNSLFKDLDNKKQDAILIDETYYNIKKEEEDTGLYQILYKITVRTVVKEQTKTVDVTKNPFTIYISGIDVYGNIETVSRSDVNILMTVNPQTKQILLTTIPRDYYVQLSGTTGYKDKLTHAGNYGINMSVDTIEDLLGIDINYYIRVNFSTLENLIDSLDGVDVYSEYQFVSYIDNYQFYKGYNHMNGKQALAFSRERKSLPGGDNDRGKNQEAVIESIIIKATSKEIIYKYSKILSNLNGTFQTNLSNTDITNLIQKELENIGGWNITSNSLTGTGSMDYTYSYSYQKLYVTIPNEESITKAKNLIKKVNNGELLETTYNKNIGNIQNPNKVIAETPKETPKEEKKEEKTEEDIKENIDDDEPLEDIIPQDEQTEEDDNKENKDNPIDDLLPQEETDTN